MFSQKQKFYRKLKSLILSQNLNQLSPVIHIADYYINLALGMILQKPKGWFFGESQEIEKMLTSTRFTYDKTRESLYQSLYDSSNSDSADFIFEDGLLDYYDKICDEIRVLASREVPICVISKEPLNSSADTFAAAITIFLNETIVTTNTEHREMVHEELEALHVALPDFVPLEKSRKCRISGYMAYEYYANFSFEHENISGSIPVRALIVSIKHNDAIYDCKLYDAPELGPDMVFDYTGFLSGILLK